MASLGRNVLGAGCSCSLAIRSITGSERTKLSQWQAGKEPLQSLSDKTVSAGGLLPERVCGQPRAEVGGNAGK